MTARRCSPSRPLQASRRRSSYRPALFLFHYALRYRPPVGWITDFWRYPVRLGDVAIVFALLAAFTLVLLRRGNFPVIGASGAELGLRELLSEYFARPRFKELLGHPLAVLRPYQQRLGRLAQRTSPHRWRGGASEYHQLV